MVTVKGFFLLMICGRHNGHYALVTGIRTRDILLFSYIFFLDKEKALLLSPALKLFPSRMESVMLMLSE